MVFGLGYQSLRLTWFQKDRLFRDYYHRHSLPSIGEYHHHVLEESGLTIKAFLALALCFLVLRKPRGLEQKNSYDSDGDLGICGIAPTKPDVALLTCLDPGWMPWRRHSLDKMKAGVWLPDSQKATDYEDTDDDGQELEDTGAEVIM